MRRGRPRSGEVVAANYAGESLVVGSEITVAYLRLMRKKASIAADSDRHSRRLGIILSDNHSSERKLGLDHYPGFD